MKLYVVKNGSMVKHFRFSKVSVAFFANAEILSVSHILLCFCSAIKSNVLQFFKQIEDEESNNKHCMFCTKLPSYLEATHPAEVW